MLPHNELTHFPHEHKTKVFSLTIIRIYFFKIQSSSELQVFCVEDVPL